MTRLERFRISRKHKKYKYLSIIIAFLLFFSGLYIVDYSIGKLMGQNEHMGVLRVRYSEKSLYELYFMNKKFYINTSYLEKEIQRLKNLF